MGRVSCPVGQRISRGACAQARRGRRGIRHPSVGLFVGRASPTTGARGGSVGVQGRQGLAVTAVSVVAAVFHGLLRGGAKASADGAKRRTFQMARQI